MRWKPKRLSSLPAWKANPDDQLAWRIEWLTDEAVQSSAIEGETLRRDLVQESLMRRMGLRPNARRHDNAEEGIAAMMVDLYRNATRDLNALVEIGILRRTGSLRHTRYWLDWQSLENLM